MPRVKLVLWSALGWTIFAAAWWRLPEREGPTAGMVLAVAAAAVVSGLVTAWWVRHNKAIYRRKGPRRAVPAVARRYATDSRGRPVRMDAAEVRRAREVTLALTPEGEKIYSVAE